MLARRWRQFLRHRATVSAVLLAVLVILATQSWQSRRDESETPFRFDSSGPYRVKRVVDGDTLLLDDGTRVRLLGVDTPETKHPTKPATPLGLEASEFTRRHVEGRTITLQFDRERRDRYRRVLAYVYRDDWLLNEELIRAGYSRAETRFPYSTRMKKRFREAENDAKAHHRGMWAENR